MCLLTSIDNIHPGLCQGSGD